MSGRMSASTNPAPKCPSAAVVGVLHRMTEPVPRQSAFLSMHCCRYRNSQSRCFFARSRLETTLVGEASCPNNHHLSVPGCRPAGVRRPAHVHRIVTHSCRAQAFHRWIQPEQRRANARIASSVTCSQARVTIAVTRSAATCGLRMEASTLRDSSTSLRTWQRSINRRTGQAPTRADAACAAPRSGAHAAQWPITRRVAHDRKPYRPHRDSPQSPSTTGG
jgi:hypothetical protein